MTLNRIANETNEEIENAAETGWKAATDVARRGVETSRDVAETTLSTANDAFRRVTDQVTQVLGFNGPQAEELARRSSRNVEAMTQAGSALAPGAQDVSQEIFGLIEERIRTNIDAVNRLAGARSVPDLVAVQSDLVRDGLRQALETGRRVAEMSLRTADEAARAIGAGVQANAGRVRRAA